MNSGKRHVKYTWNILETSDLRYEIPYLFHKIISKKICEILYELISNKIFTKIIFELIPSHVLSNKFIALI